jgi:hypothetical protein
VRHSHQELVLQRIGSLGAPAQLSLTVKYRELCRGCGIHLAEQNDEHRGEHDGGAAEDERRIDRLTPPRRQQLVPLSGDGKDQRRCRGRPERGEHHRAANLERHFQHTARMLPRGRKNRMARGRLANRICRCRLAKQDDAFRVKDGNRSVSTDVDLAQQRPRRLGTERGDNRTLDNAIARRQAATDRNDHLRRRVRQRLRQKRCPDEQFIGGGPQDVLRQEFVPPRLSFELRASRVTNRSFSIDDRDGADACQTRLGGGQARGPCRPWDVRAADAAAMELKLAERSVGSTKTLADVRREDEREVVGPCSSGLERVLPRVSEIREAERAHDGEDAYRDRRDRELAHGPPV